MPTVNSATLTLTTVNQNVEIAVEYVVTITPFERDLVERGMELHSHIDVLGVDAGSHTVLATFDRQSIPVNSQTSNTFTLDRSMDRTRAQLQEDTGLGDNDEIGCNVRLHCELPPEFTPDFFTTQRILTG